MSAGFFRKVAERASSARTHLCVGLDPRVSSAAELVTTCMRVVDATWQHAAVFKPNAAFFEAHGSAGVRALEELVAKLPVEVPCLLDAKRGDIGDTNAAYARGVSALGATAVTVSPYLGVGALAPFLSDTELSLFVLGRTSNPEAEPVQDARLWSGEAVFERVADEVHRLNLPERVGLVVGATEPSAIAKVRTRAPQSWLLLPGIGAQGGDLRAAVSAARRTDGSGFLVNVSRGIERAADMGAEASRLRDEIEAVRILPAAQEDESRERTRLARVRDVARVLFESQCVRFGTFTLKSGKESPVYVDLRRLVTFPRALGFVADVLAGRLATLAFDRIAALPYAALPIGTAVSLRTDRPMIYPRGQAKTYGAKASIEGLFNAGERVVVLDDIATRGDAKLEALGPLAEAGLTVSDVVVLVDREQGARALLAERGITLHAELTLRELVESLGGEGKISSDERERVLRFLNEEGT